MRNNFFFTMELIESLLSLCVFFSKLIQVRMDGHCFISAVLYALIGFDTFISKPMAVYALSLPSSSSSSSSSLLSPLSPATTDNQQHDRPNNNANKNRPNNNNNIGNNANNNIPMSKPKLMCKISEWKCPNGTCISLSKFCDGIPDCADRSDEPDECSGEWENPFFAHLFFSFCLFRNGKHYCIINIEQLEWMCFHSNL